MGGHPFPQYSPTNGHESKETRRKQLSEKNWSKIQDTKLVENKEIFRLSVHVVLFFDRTVLKNCITL